MNGKNKFMEFYESDDFDDLSVDERRQIFLTCLMGSADITKDLILELFDDYGIDHLEVKEK